MFLAIFTLLVMRINRKEKLMKEKIKQAKEWCVNHKLELASIIVIPAAVYAVLTYREHQKEFAYTRGIADGGRAVG